MLAWSSPWPRKKMPHRGRGKLSRVLVQMSYALARYMAVGTFLTSASSERSHVSMFQKPLTKSDRAARSDAPRTLSKSCSDKIALKLCTSLLSSLASLLISPTNAYLHTVVLPSSQHSGTACARAFGPEGRLEPLSGRHWPGGYSYRPFATTITDVEFERSRRSAPASTPLIASNISALYTPHVQQSLIGGRLAGRRAIDARSASAVSRRNMWASTARVVGLLETASIARAMTGGEGKSYSGLKADSLLAYRRKVKTDAIISALKGWSRNSSDDFGLDSFQET